MNTVDAVYEGGVFKPTSEVSLPEGVRVVVNLPSEPSADDSYLDKIYEIMSRSYETGDPTLAARHNEHQP